MQKQNAYKYGIDIKDGLEKKANHNKNEALWCFRIVMGATLLAPLFVTLGTDIIMGKIVPSVLSIGAAFSTAWLQLRKPQQLWALYRTAQRELEVHLTKFEYKIDEYKNKRNSDPNKILVKHVADIALDVHYKWLPIVPNPEDFKETEKSVKNKEC